jgi:hypothetical protein
MLPWKERLQNQLEPLLANDQAVQNLSRVYHDMPFGIFLYPPTDEWALREELRRLQRRLENAGKRVYSVSLAQSLSTAFDRELPLSDLIEAEQVAGLEASIDTVHQILGEYAPLIDLVMDKIPPKQEQDPMHDLIWLTRAGALYPVYRTSSLLEQLKGQVIAPCILFYPGETEGAAGLRFMGVLEAEHNYRPRIF